jgi:hypothetical protein
MPGKFIWIVCMVRPPTTRNVLPSSPPKAALVPPAKRPICWFCGLMISPFCV